jgi:hypothetical protein
MSLTTTLATPVMLENRGSGNKRMKHWPSKVLRIHTTNSIDVWDHLCAHSKPTESGNVSFYGQSTTEVAQRALRESCEDSNGERENDALTKALQTKEKRGRVRGVSSKLTWKEGFLEHKSMYWKRKMTSTPHVNVEELKDS